MKIFVVGSLNIDLVIRAPKMPEAGMTLSGSDFMMNEGGKGANQAVAVSKLGGECYMVGCVGNEFGDRLKDTLQSYGVHTDFVLQRNQVASGTAVIVVVDGDNRIILDQGANATVDEALVDLALSQAQAGDFLVVQLEIPVKTVAYALKRAKEKGMTTVLNPAPAHSVTDEILSYCDYFIPNQTEAQFYTGIYPGDERSVKQCAQKLAELGVKNVIITVGADGSVCVSNGQYYKVDSFPATVVDTTAAGDTYVGALVTALSEEKGLVEAMTFASKAASVTITRRGAQQSIAYRHEVE